MPPSPSATRRRARRETAEREPHGSAQDGAYEGVHLTPDECVAAFHDALDAGDGWYDALLAVIARWTAPSEVVGDTTHRYLLSGEAFDWLLLAQRILDTARERLPAEEVERLLVHGLPPEETTEADFARAIGAQKYRAHLNFQYGVTVEEVLLLAAELEIQKSGLANAGRPAPDVEAYEHVYGKPLEELRVLYHAESDGHLGDRASQSEVQAFTYWLSKYRLRTGEPARVASDTRKALALLSRLEAGRRAPAASASSAAQAARDVIDLD